MKKILASFLILMALTAGAASVDGYLKILSGPVASKPTCAAALRGMIFQIQNVGSTADYSQVCILNAATAYAWASLTQQ